MPRGRGSGNGASVGAGSGYRCSLGHSIPGLTNGIDPIAHPMPILILILIALTAAVVVGALRGATRRPLRPSRPHSMSRARGARPGLTAGSARAGRGATSTGTATARADAGGLAIAAAAVLSECLRTWSARFPTGASTADVAKWAVITPRRSRWTGWTRSAARTDARSSVVLASSSSVRGRGGSAPVGWCRSSCRGRSRNLLVYTRQGAASTACGPRSTRRRTLGPSFPSGHTATAAASTLLPPSCSAGGAVTPRAPCCRAAPRASQSPSRLPACPRRPLADRRDRRSRARLGLVRGLLDRVRWPLAPLRRRGRSRRAAGRPAADQPGPLPKVKSIL